jgi:hypothetical protein
MVISVGHALHTHSYSYFPIGELSADLLFSISHAAYSNREFRTPGVLRDKPRDVAFNHAKITPSYPFYFIRPTFARETLYSLPLFFLFSI